MNLPDARHIANGRTIPARQYCDQPYVVRDREGAWVCLMTTGSGIEGAPGQTIVCLRSEDRGRSWSEPVELEPADGPEASYAVPLATPSGRIYAFYNHNTDDLREVRNEDGGVFQRVDSLGHYTFKFSDDGGRSWSRDRYEVPVREFACDRGNVYGGAVRFFWNVGKPIVHEGAMVLPLHKVAAMGRGFFAQSEGVFLRSENILTEPDPAKIVFETLPDGDEGLRTPPGGGRVAEEQCIVSLCDGSLMTVYRSIDGWGVCSYSRDGGHHWSTPQYMAHRPGGRRMKHPRAANFAWSIGNGRYLYWYHNHGGPAAHLQPGGWNPYEDRNPVWLAPGVEEDGPEGRIVVWGEPEITLYDDDPFIRMSYPDLVVEQGRYFLTETQKRQAYVHEIDGDRVEAMFSQFADAPPPPRDENLLMQAVETDGDALPAELDMPPLPAFRRRGEHGLPGLHTRAGVTVQIECTLEDLAPGRVLLDSRTEAGVGMWMVTAAGGAVELHACDGRCRAVWASDEGVLREGERCRVAAIVDGGPKLILFVAGGRLCDGGEKRQFGFGRFSPDLYTLAGSQSLRLGTAAARIHAVRIYGRALWVCEAVALTR